MKGLLFGLFCLVSIHVQGLQYETQFENDQISVAKATIEAREEIGLHRDAYPQVVIALKGGTITRLEANGQKTDVQFPTGVAVMRGVDPVDELHKSVNNSDDAVELLIIQLKDSQTVAIDGSHNISVNIKINGPDSLEFQEFVKSIPPAGNYTSEYSEWKSSFVNNMNQLIHLVESEKVFSSDWSVKTDYKLPEETK